MPAQQKAKAKGRKIGRQIRRGQAGIYASSARLETNRKRRIRRHLASFPNDLEAVKALGVQWAVAPNHKGRKVLARAPA